MVYYNQRVKAASMTSNGKIQITDIDGSVVICDEWFLDLTWSKFVGEYKDKNGNRLYPDIYIAKKELVKKFPVKFIRGIKLHVVPIAKLKIKEIK